MISTREFLMSHWIQLIASLRLFLSMLTGWIRWGTDDYLVMSDEPVRLAASLLKEERRVPMTWQSDDIRGTFWLFCLGIRMPAFKFQRGILSSQIKSLSPQVTATRPDGILTIPGNLLRLRKSAKGSKLKPCEVTTSGGLKTAGQLSRMRTTKTKYCALSSSLFYMMFEFEKLSKCM